MDNEPDLPHPEFPGTAIEHLVKLVKDFLVRTPLALAPFDDCPKKYDGKIGTPRAVCPNRSIRLVGHLGSSRWAQAGPRAWAASGSPVLGTLDFSGMELEVARISAYWEEPLDGLRHSILEIPRVLLMDGDARHYQTRTPAVRA